MPKTILSNLHRPDLKHVLHSNSFRVEQPSRIELQLNKNEILRMEQIGGSLIVVLKNGEQIVIEQFFTPERTSPHQLLLGDEQNKLIQAQFDENAQLLDYDSVQTTASNTQTPPPPTVNASLESPSSQPTELSTSETETDEKPSFMKIGLAILAVDAAYLLLNKKDKNNSSNEAKAPDLTPPTITSGSLNDDGNIIVGVTEANIRVYATNQAGKIIGETRSDAKGNFTIQLKEAVINNALLSIKAVDHAGNESKPVVFKGNKDTIAPTEANAQINDQGLIISGKAEALAKVYIFDATGKNQIAGPVYTAKDGSFSISLKTPLAHGTQAMVMVQDDAGNKSKLVSVEVGKDTLAPEQPLIEVALDGSSIQGIAEALTKISIFSSNGQVLATGQTDNKGKFNLKLQPALSKEQTASIVLEDMAGNKSTALNFKAGQDNIAPDKASASLNAEGSIISGTAEANATIEVYNQQGNKIGSSTVGADGKFNLTLTAAVVNNNLVKVYVIDRALNKSSALELTGHKDTIAPNKVVLKSVSDQVGELKTDIQAGGNSDDPRPVFSGTAEANAILTIYNHGFAIGSVVVDNKGVWSFKPTIDLAFGQQSFSFTQMDAGNNTSEMSDSFQFNVIPPSTASTLLLLPEADLTLDLADYESILEPTSSHSPLLTTDSAPQGQGLTNISLEQLFLDQQTTANTPFSHNISPFPFDSASTTTDLVQLLQPMTTYIA